MKTKKVIVQTPNKASFGEAKIRTLNGVLIATAAAAIFATLPVNAVADSATTVTSAATKATNNCCGAHDKSTSSSTKKRLVTQNGSDKLKPMP